MAEVDLRRARFAAFGQRHLHVIGQPVVRVQDALEDVLCGVVPLSDEQTLHARQIHAVAQQEHHRNCGDLRLPELVDENPPVRRIRAQQLLLRRRGGQVPT